MDKGSAYPQIINAYNQFDYNHQYFQFLVKRRKKRLDRYVNPVNLALLSLLVLFVSGPVYYMAIGSLCMFFGFSILYLFYMPMVYHEDLKSGFIRLIHCTNVYSAEIQIDLIQFAGPMSTVNMVCIGVVVLFGAFAVIPSFIGGLLVGLAVFIIWYLLILCGLIAAFLPYWVYRSGAMFPFICGIIFLSYWAGLLASGVGWVPFWGGAFEEYNRYLIALLLGDIFLGIITYIVWRMVPEVAEMRRRGVFD